MLAAISVAIGGAIGALGRYFISVTMAAYNTGKFPYGTLTVNVLGSLLIGVLFIVFLEKVQLADSLRPLLVVGFLGSLTTFSTFSLEALNLLQKGDHMLALTYIGSSVLLCLLATAAGMQIGRLAL